jgi:hypothetical protein
MYVRGPAGVREDVIFRHPPGRLSGSSTFPAAGTLGSCRARPLRDRANSRAMGAGRPRWARRLVEIECRIAARHSRLMWVLADVVGSFSIKVGPFSANVGRDHRIFSANLGPKRQILSGQAVYVLGPLQLAMPPRPVFPGSPLLEFLTG